MITTIFHVADIHIPNSNENRPYDEMLKGFIKTLAQRVKDCGQDNCRIVLAGDIFHNKVKISNEAMAMFHTLLNYLNQIAKTYIIAGNHDMLENNQDKMDSLTPTFEIDEGYENIVYMDKVLGYKSGCILDDNIVFALYSMHDKFSVPNIQDYAGDGRVVVGLYHGDMAGTVTDAGRMSDGGIDTDVFKPCDCVMAGHIHKFQTIKKNGVPVVYAGSLFQQDMGENTSVHGFVEWDMETLEYQHVEVENNYRFFKLSVNSYDDIKDDVEEIINL